MSDDKKWADRIADRVAERVAKAAAPFMERAVSDAIELATAIEKKRYEILTDKANSLARLVEQVAYAPVAGYYEAKGNDAPLRLLRLAVEDIDNLTSKGGAR